MTNLLVLAISFLSVAIGFIGNFVFKLTGVFQEYFIFIGFVSFVYFTNMTFHRNKMKVGNLVLILVIILGIIQLVLFNLYSSIEIKRGFHYYLRVSLDFPYTFIVFNWLTISCYSAYNRLKKIDIEPWIKVRYKLIAISSFILSFHNIPEFFQPKNIRWGNPSDPISLIIFGITTILMMVYAIMFSISWFMPKWLKKYFNKDYKSPIEKEYSEEELMNLIKEQINKNDY